VLLANSSPSSGFSSGNAKIAAFCNKFKSTITLSTQAPPQALATWTTGTRATYPALSAAAAFAALTQPPAQTSLDCATVPPLKVSGARFGIFEFPTDRGKAQISTWMFTVSGANGEIAYPAVAAPSVWNADLMHGLLDTGTTVSADGRFLTFGFWGAPSSSGPCGATYAAAVAESQSAVAVAIQEIPNASSGDAVVCPAVAQQRSVEVALANPLGGRVVLDNNANAVSVCPALVKDC
jgi:hypothetical protein